MISVNNLGNMEEKASNSDIEVNQIRTVGIELTQPVAAVVTSNVTDSLGIISAGFIEVFRYSPSTKICCSTVSSTLAACTGIIVLFPILGFVVADCCESLFRPSSCFKPDIVQSCCCTFGSNVYKIAIGDNLNMDDESNSQSDITRILSAREEGPESEMKYCPVSREWDLAFRDEHGNLQFTIKKRRVSMAPFVFSVCDSQDVLIGFIGKINITFEKFYDNYCNRICRQRRRGDDTKFRIPIFDADRHQLFNLRAVDCDCSSTIRLESLDNDDDLGFKIKKFSGPFCGTVRHPEMSGKALIYRVIISNSNNEDCNYSTKYEN